VGLASNLDQAYGRPTDYIDDLIAIANSLPMAHASTEPLTSQNSIQRQPQQFFLPLNCNKTTTKSSSRRSCSIAASSLLPSALPAKLAHYNAVTRQVKHLLYPVRCRAAYPLYPAQSRVDYGFSVVDSLLIPSIAFRPKSNRSAQFNLLVAARTESSVTVSLNVSLDKYPCCTRRFKKLTSDGVQGFSQNFQSALVPHSRRE
jgi:hypothetical protein